MSEIELSIIIVNYNGANLVNDCIESVYYYLDRENNSLKHLYSDDKKKGMPGRISWEVIVVDNASTDESLDYLRELAQKNKEVELIENSKNLGFAKACNIAAGRASGKFLLFLNPDTRLVTTGLRKILDLYNSLDRPGALGVRIEGEEKELHFSCRSFPTIARQFYESYMLHRVFKNSLLFGSYFLSYWNHANMSVVDWVTGAYLLIDSKVYGKVGGFDEDYFLFSEDTDICFKLKKMNYSNYYYPLYRIIHKDSAIALRDTVKREVDIWRSRRLYFRKNYSLCHALSVSFLYLLGMVNRAIIYLLISLFREGRKNREKAVSYLKVIKEYYSNEK